MQMLKAFARICLSSVRNKGEKMKFAYSSNAFKRYSIEETAKMIKEAGFDGIEVMADTPHVYPKDYDNQKLDRLKDYLDSLGLEVSNINAFTLEAIQDMHHPSFIEKDKALRAIRIEHTKRSLWVAKKLGAKSISIIPGGRVEYFTEAESLELFIKGLKEILPEAERLGIKVLVEPEPELLIENSSQFETFLSRIKHPNLGFNCDLGHFFCVNENPAEIIKKFST